MKRRTSIARRLGYVDAVCRVDIPAFCRPVVPCVGSTMDRTGVHVQVSELSQVGLRCGRNAINLDRKQSSDRASSEHLHHSQFPREMTQFPMSASRVECHCQEQQRAHRRQARERGRREKAESEMYCRRTRKRGTMSMVTWNSQ